MKIMILGAASRIGGRIAVAISPGNELLLVSRRGALLTALVKECRAAGATDTEVVSADLKNEGPASVVKLAERRIDVLINAASATSRLADSQCSLEDVSAGLHVDAISPLSLVGEICNRRMDSRLTVVFLTTILSTVRVPGRAIYGSLKYLQELGLKAAASKYPNLRVLTVRIGARFPRDRDIPAMDVLARTIVSALRSDAKEVNFGFGGRVLRLLYRVHPGLGGSAVLLQRLLRGLSHAISRFRTKPSPAEDRKNKFFKFDALASIRSNIGRVCGADPRNVFSRRIV
jgi:NADP-dependent 3-hydroxy acid dehydrogenase YdfG